MTEQTVVENGDYHVRNDELFERLRALEEDLKGVLAGGESALAPKRAKGSMVERWLRIQIDTTKAELVRLHQPLMSKYVGKFSGRASATERDDFRSAGNMALCEALVDYDPTRGRFTTRAYHPLQRHVITEFRRSTLPQLPASDFERRPLILQTMRTLTKKTGTAPTPQEVADHAKLPLPQVKRVMTATPSVSLEQPMGDSELPLSETLCGDDRDFGDQLHSDTTATLLRTFGLTCLSEQELLVLVRVFGLDGEDCENLADLGKQMGKTREAARQTKARALAKLGHPTVLRALMQTSTSARTSTSATD